MWLAVGGSGWGGSGVCGWGWRVDGGGVCGGAFGHGRDRRHIAGAAEWRRERAFDGVVDHERRNESVGAEEGC